MKNSKTRGLSELACEANRRINLSDGKLTAMKALIDALKYPVWLKDSEGRMVIINQAYTDKFGIKAEEYEGKLDSEIWPEHIADEYRTNDAKALEATSHVEAFENVPTVSGVELLYIIKTGLEIDGKKYIKGEALKVADMRLIVRICDGE